MPRPMPAAEVELDVARVRRLLEEQHPDLATLSIEPASVGWDNAIFRLGDALLVRLPRREVAARLVEQEQRWLPVLAPALPLSVPVPIRVGRPGAGFPWPWSVCPWFEGRTAAEEPFDEEAAALDLGAFVVALHREAPETAPRNEVRGGALSGRTPALEERLALLEGSLDEEAVRALWREAVAVPRGAGPRVWLHGDLHPANLLIRDRRLVAVLDFGDLTAGDPATDLAVAWMLFDARGRQAFRDAAGAPDEATWARARGWALALAVAFLAHSADAPHMRAVGERTLAAVLADPR